MRILLCSPCRVDPRLGAAKMLMELGSALERQGCAVEIVGPEHVGATDKTGHPARLKAYLSKHAKRFDVVDFDHKRLVYRRGLLPEGVLAVCRAQLLQHHALAAPLPAGLRGRKRLWAMASKFKHRVVRATLLRQCTANFRAAHLSSVLNRPAAELLLRLGVPPDRILVFPNALAEEREASLRRVPETPPSKPVVGFIGMFSPRKGGADLPLIARHLRAFVPEVQLHLLGTRGMLGTADEVIHSFPEDLRSHIHVVPAFAPEDLPGLLEGCSVGVFPSYAEGFPLGVLEMLAAAMPVVAYDAPGASELLPREWLVPLGRPTDLAERIAALLIDTETLRAARHQARTRAAHFDWSETAARTVEAYDAALTRIRSPLTPVIP